MVAVRDLVPGRPIAADDLVLRTLPMGDERREAFGEVTEVVGRTPRERILLDEVIRYERLARPDAGSALDGRLTPGSRAVTLGFDRDAGWTPLLREEDRVDLVWIQAPPPAPAPADHLTRTVVEAARVLGTRPTSRTEPGGADPSHVVGELTLEVSPSDLNTLAEASATGTLHVLLRSPLDIPELSPPQASASRLAESRP